MIKGEIWWANLPDDPYGSEPGKRRPVVIIQNDAFNKSSIRTTICASITSNMKLAQFPGNIELEKAFSGLDKSSVINFSQIITIDKSRLTEQVSMLPKTTFQRLTKASDSFLIQNERTLHTQGFDEGISFAEDVLSRKYQYEG